MQQGPALRHPDNSHLAMDPQGQERLVRATTPNEQILQPSMARTSSVQSKTTGGSKRKKDGTQTPSAAVLTRSVSDVHDRNRKIGNTMTRYQRLACLWRSRKLAEDTATPVIPTQADTMQQGLRLQRPREARTALCLFAPSKRKDQHQHRLDNRLKRQRTDLHLISSRLLPMDRRHLLPASHQELVAIRNSSPPTKSSLSTLPQSNRQAHRRTTTSRLRLHLRRRNRPRSRRRLA